MEITVVNYKDSKDEITLLVGQDNPVWDVLNEWQKVECERRELSLIDPLAYKYAQGSIIKKLWSLEDRAVEMLIGYGFANLGEYYLA